LIEAELPEEGRVRIVNSGFPVNFDGNPDPIATDLTQLTRALIVVAL